MRAHVYVWGGQKRGTGILANCSSSKSGFLGPYRADSSWSLLGSSWAQAGPSFSKTAFTAPVRGSQLWRPMFLVPCSKEPRKIRESPDPSPDSRAYSCDMKTTQAHRTATIARHANASTRNGSTDAPGPNALLAAVELKLALQVQGSALGLRMQQAPAQAPTQNASLDSTAFRSFRASR